MDNLVFRYFLRYWPVILAIVITVLLIYQWSHPKVSADKLQKGLLKQQVLLALEEHLRTEEDPEQEKWRNSQQKIARFLSPKEAVESPATPQIHYQSYISISLVWTLLWIGVDTFLIIRICFAPYYYGQEGIFLGCFTYYIIVGLISYFRK